MTEGIPMYLAYAGFLVGAGLLGLLTYRVVRGLDRAKAARTSGSGG
jgi:hypothetical protein